MESAVAEFLQNKAKSVGSSVGFSMPATLTTVCYILSTKGVKVKLTDTFCQSVNLYAILIGPPSTAKSPAMKEAVTMPLEEVLKDFNKTVVSNITSSGLTKLLSKEGKCFICSPEIFDVLNKFAKSDEENATGDMQLLCKMFSGEKCSYHFSTEQVREIAADTPFGILGSTQVSKAAHLLCRMDNGHGLVDRFLLAIPPAFRPLPEEEKECNRILQEGHLNSIGSIYEHILNLHNDDITYYFEDDADDILEKLQYEHIQQINEALQNGDCTPQTKKCDIIPRLAVGIHVFQHVTKALLAGNEVQPVPQSIEKKTVERAIDYCSYLESQKEIFLVVCIDLLPTIIPGNAELSRLG